MDFVMKGKSVKMTNFIEVSRFGLKRLVNLRNVQEIYKEDSSGKCTIYFSNADYFTPDEGYDDIVDMLWKAGQYLEGHKKYD